MKYVALLRGINVGGNSIVSMAGLKAAFEKAGFSNVSTFINSGNVIFESLETNTAKLTEQIDGMLAKNFFVIRTVVVSQKELEQILDEVPARWKKDDVRKYVAFLRGGTTPDDVIQTAQLKEGVDFLDKGHRVVYMSTLMEGLSKSSFPKLSSKKIYQDMTIRIVTTVQKLAALLIEGIIRES